MEVPDAIASVFEKLKEQYEFSIVLTKVKNHFYVYKAENKWDKATKKVKSIREYLGRITDDGIFIKKAASYKEIELEKAKAILKANGYAIRQRTPEDIAQRHVTTYSDQEADEIDKKILMYLSMNARASVSHMAKFIGLSISKTQNRIKHLEHRYDIKYLLEVDVEKLGFTPYIILIKFEDEIPTSEELVNAIRDEPKIQFAAITKGEYNVVMFAIDEDPLTTNADIIRIRKKPSINRYPSRWNQVYFAERYPFMPLTDEFIKHVLKDKLWKKASSKKQDNVRLQHRELLLLQELNMNSSANFTEIDNKYGLAKGTSRYAYQSLKDRGIIVRPTISLTNLPTRYIGIILIANINEIKIQEHRYQYLFDLIEYGRIVNRYVLIGNIDAPNGSILFLPVFAEEPIETINKRIYEELQGSIVKNMLVSEVIRGNLCFRRFDNVYSKQYQQLLEGSKIENKFLVDYK